jgi:beta-amylase
LPSFVTEQSDIWFKDQKGAQTKEYISFFADRVAVHGGRTPLDMYADWFQALASTFEPKLGNTITEIQVGLGPCGELRYPAYPLERGWSFCGVGEFQCWDKHALANFSGVGHSQGYTSPPTNAGSYNSRPWDADFFRDGYKSDYGKFFLDWYFGTMKSHAAEVLDKVNAVFLGRVALASKVAGIHWWYGHESHASELTAGYYNTDSRNAYAEIADTFASNGAALDFTCLEMRNSEQSSECKSQPENLVNQVRDAAQQKKIHFNGENALPRYDWTAYEKILQNKQALFAFTYLRLDQKLLGDGYDAFKGFVHQMHQD